MNASSWVTLRIRHVFELTQTCWGSFVHFPYRQGYNQPKNWLTKPTRPTVSRARWARSGCRWLASWLGPWGTGLGVGMERGGGGEHLPLPATPCYVTEMDCRRVPRVPCVPKKCALLQHFIGRIRQRLFTTFAS